MIRAVFLVLFLLAAGCSPRGEIDYDPSAPRVGLAPEIFIGTSRNRDPATGQFGTERVTQQTLGRYVVQVPPDRQPGTIKWPTSGRAPDPRTDFLTVDEEIYPDARAFRAALSDRLQKLPPGHREVRVFVHGFNTNFAEGLYRLAQLDEDLRLPGVSVLYSWPSRAKPLAYLADRDTAIFARDGYEQFLNEIVAAGAERIILVGHSMGSVVTMETLRQIAIGKNRALMDRIAGVVLLAPDIDVDVFEMAARKIGKLPQPFFIFTSDKDKALSLSARLSGRTKRLGNLDAPEKLAALDITVVDTSAFSIADGHFNVGKSPALISIIGSMVDINKAFSADTVSNGGLFTQTVARFQNARVVTIKPTESRAGERG